MIFLAATLFIAAPIDPPWLNAYDKDVCSERSPEVPRDQCLAAEVSRVICAGPRDIIPDNDPALTLFEGPLEDRKIALAIERINSCDTEDTP